MPEIEFVNENVIGFADINGNVTCFEAVGVAPTYLERIFGSRTSSTHQFDGFLDFFDPALINPVVNF